MIIWDKLFGTFVPENSDYRPDYGLVKDFDTHNPFRIFIYEYLGIAKDITRIDLSFYERLLYIFAPPGWSHDGSRQTSIDIKKSAGLLDATVKTRMSVS